MRNSIEVATRCGATLLAALRFLAEAEATLAKARHVAANDASPLERTSTEPVTAPPGSLNWSVRL
jgi:hypothetical protein